MWIGLIVIAFIILGIAHDMHANYLNTRIRMEELRLREIEASAKIVEADAQGAKEKKG